jgi:hypothetical protein
MKNYAMFAALSMFSIFASANDQINSSTKNAPVEDYAYSQHLDIAKVIQVTADNANSCGPIEAHMIYDDSKGVRHNLEYTRIGDGCQNG